jgi:hypothetical protein
MALQASFNMTFVDSAERRSTISPYVKENDAQAFVAAADEAARDATELGLMAAAFAELSEMTLEQRYVSYGDKYNTAPPAPNSGIYRGNKLTIHYRGSGRGFVITIPGRDDANLSLNGVNADISVGDLGDLVTILENVAVDINGGAITVTSADVND